MKYKKSLQVRTKSGYIVFTADERNLLIVSYMCPNCGTKHNDTTFDALVTIGKSWVEDDPGFYYCICKKCREDMFESLRRRLKAHMEELKVSQPAIFAKLKQAYPEIPL